MDKDASQDRGYVAFDAADEEFFGARRIVEQEYAFIRHRRGETAPNPQDKPRPDHLTGVALSGGGIRSASFCLGVLQALAYRGWLKKVDYLSTVSGGGYIGASLTWLLHRSWQDPESAQGRITFGVDNDNFPYGTYPVAGSATRPGAFKSSYKGRMLRYLRQNGRYLTPGHGISWLSLAAVVLRNSLFSVVVYGLLLLITFLGLGGWVLFPEVRVPDLGGLSSKLPDTLNVSLWGALALGVLFVLSVFLYSLGTSMMRHLHFIRVHYMVRRWYEKSSGLLLGSMLALVIVGLLPHVHDWIVGVAAKQQAVIQDFVIKGTQGAAGKLEIQGTIEQASSHKGDRGHGDMFAVAAGALSTLLGILASVMTFMQTQSTKKARIPTGLLVAIGTGALLFGMLLLTYHAYRTLWDGYGGGALATVLAGLIVSFVLIARVVNINYMSVHRYYRDRLMETFMPDVPTALDVNGTTAQASHEADRARLYQMWPPTGKAPLGPYHIINTNVVLVSSDIPKFRGRGGDNFIFTPHFSGSNATGWVGTERFYPWMTLSSAMAISGAAVNPNTGGGGKGVTRQPILAFLMGLLNIRLGYWLPNPMPSEVRLARQGSDSAIGKLFHWMGEKLCPGAPNAICPGLMELFFRKNLDDTSRMLQLTDGGHFENLGVYELIRRKLPLIIACDGVADPGFGFDDLANAIEKVRADFGVIIEIDCTELEKLTPQRTYYGSDEASAMRYAEQGYLLARIKYPDPQRAGHYAEGTLIYLTTSFFKALTPDLFGYRKANAEFPDEPTSDQFFDERQFEAYRELGYQTAWKMLSDPVVWKDPQVLAAMGPRP